MKRLVMTLAITCALSTTVLAGEVPSVGILSTKPSETAQGSSSITPGNLPTGGYAQQFSDTALNLVEVMFGWWGI